MHKSVLLQEVITAILPKDGGVFVDATFGAGGHSRSLANAIGRTGHLIAFDADETVFSDEQMKKLAELTHFEPIIANFRTAGEKLSQRPGVLIDGAIFDLGLSSTQLEESGRGFTFQKNEPLEMTFQSAPGASDTTAFIVVNEWSEESITTILRGFGEERFARGIAKKILETRKLGSIKTTAELVEIIHESTPGWYQRGKTHFATRTFQAIRMAVNDELGAIEAGIIGVVSHMRPGARIAIISFHSIEDRTVKQLLKRLVAEGQLVAITKKPITASEGELKENPRARSAKLRVAEKCS